MAGKNVFIPGGGRPRGPVPVRTEDTIAPVPAPAAAPPAPTSPESNVGAPRDALSAISEVSPVGATTPQSPVQVGLPDAPRTVEGEVVTTPELRGVRASGTLRAKAAQDEADAARRFAVTSELPDTGFYLDEEGGAQGSLETARNFLEKSAADANLSVYSSKDALDQRDPTDKKIATILNDDMVGNFLEQSKANTNVLLRDGTVLNGALVSGDFGEAFGIDSQAKADALGPAIEIARQETADAVRKFKYAEQIGLDEGGLDKVDEKVNTENKKKLFAKAGKQAKAKAVARPEEARRESLESFANTAQELDQQPAIRGLLNHITQSINGRLGGTGSAAPYSQGAPIAVENHAAAAAILMYWIANDMMTLGTADNGMLVPILTPYGEESTRGANFFSTAFNPADRQGARGPDGFSGNLVHGQQTAPFRNKFLASEQQAYSKKGAVNVNSGNLSSTASTFLTQVGTNLNAVTFPFLLSTFQRVSEQINAKKQANEQALDVQIDAIDPVSALGGPAGIIGTQESPELQGLFADLDEDGEILGELDRGTFEKYRDAEIDRARKEQPGLAPEDYRRIGTQAANKMMSNRLDQVAKHLQKHAPRLAETPLYININSSPVTKRFFVQGAEVSFQAHSGTLRPIGGWANVVPAIGVTKEKIDNVARRAKNIYDMGSHKGEAGGMHVIDKLHSMDEGDLAVLDTLLVTGAVLAKALEGNPQFPDAENHKLWTYDQYVKFGHENLDVAAQWGQQLRQWGGNWPAPGDRPTWLQQALDGGKGEWQYPFTVLESAARLQEASDNGPASVYLDYQWETDSTQSNAFIMSSMMGDDKIMGLLGRWMDYSNLEKGDLRIVSAETLLEERQGQAADVDSTFHKEPELKEALKTFFNSAQNKGGNFAKNYGRGIVVAGLYGKTAWKMFKEADKFLSKYPDERTQLLNSYYIPKFGDNATQKMLEDMSNLFAVSMSRHMASLNNYQTMMKNITDLLAAGGNVTQIESLIPKEKIMLATEEVVPYYNEADMFDWITDKFAVEPRQVTTNLTDEQLGTTTRVGHVQKQTSLASAGGGTPYVSSQTPEDRLNRSYHGKAARAAVSPNLIQSGDTYGITVATLLANRGREGKVPKNLKTIHDAIISGAGSTSLSLVAYNNVFPHLVQKKSMGYAQRLFDTAINSMQKTLDRVPDNGFVVIGDSGDNRSVMGYYDRHFMKLQKGQISEDQWNMMTPDEQAEAMGEGFYTAEAYERLSDKAKAQHSKSLEKSRKLVEFALANGWKPPLNAHRRDRLHLRVDKDQFTNLVYGIIDGNGLLPQGYEPSVPGFVNAAAKKKLPPGTFSASYTRHMLSELHGDRELDAYGNVRKAGKQIALADKLATNGTQGKNMPVI